MTSFKGMSKKQAADYVTERFAGYIPQIEAMTAAEFMPALTAMLDEVQGMYDAINLPLDPALSRSRSALTVALETLPVLNEGRAHPIFNADMAPIAVTTLTEQIARLAKVS